MLGIDPPRDEHRYRLLRHRWLRGGAGDFHRGSQATGEAREWQRCVWSSSHDECYCFFVQDEILEEGLRYESMLYCWRSCSFAIERVRSILSNIFVIFNFFIHVERLNISTETDGKQRVLVERLRSA